MNFYKSYDFFRLKIHLPDRGRRVCYLRKGRRAIWIDGRLDVEDSQSTGYREP